MFGRARRPWRHAPEREWTWGNSNHPASLLVMSTPFVLLKLMPVDAVGMSCTPVARRCCSQHRDRLATPLAAVPDEVAVARLRRTRRWSIVSLADVTSGRRGPPQG